MKPKLTIGFNDKFVVVMSGKKLLAKLSPSQAMQLSEMSQALAGSAIHSNNQRANGPSATEMADILEAVNMVYRSDAGEVVGWDNLRGHNILGEGNKNELYYKVTKNAYTFLCSHFTGKIE